MKTIVRGNPFAASVVFRDSAGSIITPTSATLYVNFYARGRRHTDQVTTTPQQPGASA